MCDWSPDVRSSDLRSRHDLQAGGQRILGFGELQVRPAAAEEAHEELLEVGVHRLEGRQEAFSSLAVQAGDALAQAGDGVHQVAALRLHADDLLVELAGLHLGAQVDRAHVVALADQASELGLYLLARRQLLALTDLRRLERSEETTSELQSLMRNSYAVFCL